MVYSVECDKTRVELNMQGILLKTLCGHIIVLYHFGLYNVLSLWRMTIPSFNKN